MKKWGALVLISAVILSAVWRFWERHSAPEDALAPLLRIDGIQYQLDCEVGDYIGRQPDGMLTTITGNVIPREHRQANFGQNGMPYWYHQNGILVLVNDNCLLFEASDIQE